VVLDELNVPIVLAPMAGGPSTPELAAAVSEAGGLGFVAAGYLTPDATAERIAATRALTARPFGVNVFAPPARAADPADYAEYVLRISGEGKLGQPRFDDDGWQEKLELLRAEPVAVASFTFGCPSETEIAGLQAAGREVWVTVTAPEEARQAAAAGVDALIVQGGEAGGHRGSWRDRQDLPVFGLLALLQLVRREVALPLIATGGVATAAGVAAALAAGAAAVQVGTAFMLAPEAGTNPAQRAALASGRPTALTRAFTGRLARGIRNRFLDEHSAAAPIAYPEIHHVTAPLRRAARERGDAEVLNLWAGEAYALAEELPAAEIVRNLTPDLNAP
jgi:nitronate monooxygenase